MNKKTIRPRFGWHRIVWAVVMWISVFAPTAGVAMGAPISNEIENHRAIRERTHQRAKQDKQDNRNKQFALRDWDRDGRFAQRGEQRRRGRAEDQPEGPPALWERLTPQERIELRSFIEKHFPIMSRELERVQKANPRRFERRMAGIAPGIRELMQVLQEHPERAELMLQERKLDMLIRFVASQYNSTPDEPRRTEMRNKVRELCSQAFDCRHRRRELQIEELEQRLDALKRRHIEQQVRREEIISQDVKNHIGQINENPATPAED